MLVVRSKVKEIAKESGDFSMSSDFCDKLDEKVKEIIKDACQRATANNRKTIMSRDI